MNRQYRVGVEYARAQIIASPLIIENVANRYVVFRLHARSGGGGSGAGGAGGAGSAGGGFCLVLNEQNGRWIDEETPNEITMGVNCRFSELNTEIATAAERREPTWMFYRRASAERDRYEFFGRVCCIRREERGGKPFLIFVRCPDEPLTRRSRRKRRR